MKKFLGLAIIFLSFSQVSVGQEAQELAKDPPAPVDSSAAPSAVTPPPATPVPAPLVPAASAPPAPAPAPAPAPELVKPVATLQPAPPEKAAANKQWLHGSAYVFVSSAKQIRFDSVTTNGFAQTGSGHMTLDTNGSIGLGLEMWHSEPDSWGWNAGLSIDSKRDISSSSITINGVSTYAQYFSPNPTLSFTTVYGNAIYRWTGLYLPFGLNYSSPQFAQGSGANGSLNVSGAMGIQFGLGYHILDQFSLELMERVEGFKMSGTNSNIYYDFGTGYLSGLQLNAKFDF